MKVFILFQLDAKFFFQVFLLRKVATSFLDIYVESKIQWQILL